MDAGASVVPAGAGTCCAEMDDRHYLEAPRMKLARHNPPDAAEWLEIGTGRDGRPVSVCDDPPRRLRNATTEELWPALDKACGRIWGFHWRAPFEEIAGLRKGASREWQRRNQIPPPILLAWIAYIASRPDRRAIGSYLLAMARDQSGTGAAAARAIWPQIST